MRVLIVEDEKRLAENVAHALKRGPGYAVDMAYDGETGLFMAETNDYDLVILDLMLPKSGGLDIVREYRRHGRETPVLILTARDDKESVVTLLNAGADDYLPKPFDLGELLARAKALIRPGKGKPSPVVIVGDLEINTVEKSVKRGRRFIELTPIEYRVLEYLATRMPAVISKTELSEHLYDYNWEKFSNVIEVYVSGLRRKIDSHSKAKLIYTLRGQGYAVRGESEKGSKS